tara:strand:- start:7702 stop:9630 length:1929 start_codon:yes stop_codon:yes gene_type:complete
MDQHSNNQQMPLWAPASRWKPPTDLPDLSTAKIIALDLETYDPNLLTNGPGGVRNDGKIVGIAISADNQVARYYPVGHAGGGNLDREVVWKWAKKQLGIHTAHVPKVGANILYDLEWLRAEGIEVAGRCLDVQIAEPLINEESAQGYSLEVLSNKYIGKGKDEDLLKEAAIAYNVDPKKELYKLPAHYVGPYAEGDVNNTLQVWNKQEKILEDQGLTDIFKLETNLIPVLLNMRFKGVKIDINKAEQLNEKYIKEEKEMLANLRKLAGFPVEPWSNQQLAEACKEQKIWFPETQAGNPSFTSSFMNNNENEFLKNVAEFRKVNKMRRDFIEKVCLNMNYKGKIHAQFHQLRKDSDGTRTGRFSSSNPNLQQIPSRDENWGPLVRDLFIADDDCSWARLDYNQQEPRVLVHYASLRELSGAEKAADLYRSDASADFHQMVADMAGIERKIAKSINLGIMYGMGPYKLSQMLNMTYEQATELLEHYHQKVPFLRGLMHECTKAATYNGSIKTLLGRRRHFDFWEPSDFKNKYPNKEMPLRKDEAESIWKGRPLKRAHTHKALNALIQGSSADITKQAMLDLHNEIGITCHMQVHDELDFSFKNNKQLKEAQELMENCVKLEVPLKVTVETGKAWGSVKEKGGDK